MRTFSKLIIIFLCALLLSSLANAEVYKRILPDGTVEFTDVPPEKDAKPIDLPPLTTIPALPKAPARPTTTPAPMPADEQSYESLAITSPADDSAIRANDGNLSVQISATPALHPAHRYILLLDGINKAEGRSSSIQLSNIDRGTHRIQAQIVDATDKLIIQSESVSVHILRASILKP